MENELMEIFSSVKDPDRFTKFLNFCVERLNRGEEVTDIWNEWNAA